MSATWSPKAPTSAEYFTVDFIRQLSHDDVIQSCTCAISVLSGADPLASDMLSGPVVIDGTNVSQKVATGVHGVRYALTFAAATLAGETLSFAGDFYVLSAFGGG